MGISPRSWVPPGIRKGRREDRSSFQFLGWGPSATLVWGKGDLWEGTHYYWNWNLPWFSSSRDILCLTYFLHLLWFHSIYNNWWIWPLFLLLSTENIHLESTKYQTAFKVLWRNVNNMMCMIPALQEFRRKQTSIYCQSVSIILGSLTRTLRSGS